MIKNVKWGGMLMLLLIIFISCKKGNSGAEPQQQGEAKPVKHGALQGVAVTQSIGPAGGTIQSADGNIAIEVPPGAVAAATTFSVQPVENTLHAGTGTSYRLLPENVQFQKDVKITLKYTEEDLAGTSENELYMAYQDAEGLWHREVMTSIDKVNKQLSVQTRHFSDWTIERIFFIKLEQGKSSLEANEEAGLIVYWQNVDKSKNNAIIEKALVPDKNIDTWFINGPGSINNPTSSMAVIYTAPASIPQPQTIAVGVRVKNMVNTRHPDRPGTAGLAIVQVPITLLAAEYFTWTVDGTNHVAHSTDAAMLGGNTTIMGTGLTGGMTLILNGGKAGEYEGGSAMQPDKFSAQLFLSNSSTPIYQLEYYNCGSPGPKYGRGSLTIGKFGQVGNVVEGTFSAVVYSPAENCQQKAKTVYGSFKIKRKA